MKITPITALAALVLIGIGGFMAGRISFSGNSNRTSDNPAETKSVRTSSRDSSADSAATSKRPSRANESSSSSKGASTNRASRFVAILSNENPLERNRALLAFIDQLGPGDFKQAIADLRKLDLSDSREGEYLLLLSAWAEADPLAALAYADQETDDEFASQTILTTWASKDPEAAILWAQSNHEGSDANPYLSGIIRSLAASDPIRATELLATMPKSTERGDALDFFLPHLIQQGSVATQTWIAGLADEALRNGAMLRVASDLAVTDPAGTAAWLLANPSQATDRRIDDVYGTWASQDQAAALSSFAALPAGEARSDALRGLVSATAATNPQAAVTLMDRFPTDVTDRVVQNFIWQSYDTDPTIAASQISRIQDEHGREQMYRRVLSNWIDTDPAIAQAWIQANPVPQTVLDRIVNGRAKQPK